jgi:hypothetical protein
MKSMLVAVAGTLLVCVGAAADSVSVTKPAAGDTCTSGQACVIAWTASVKHGLTVSVALLDKVAPTVIRQIANNVPIGNPQFSWNVPASVVAGQYRVRVRVDGTSTDDIGDVFTIRAQSAGFKPQSGQVTKKAVTSQASNLPAAPLLVPLRILAPSPGTTWEVGKSYMIHWTANTKPDDGFTVDLLKADGTKFRTILDNAATPQGDGSWSTMGGVACNEPAGGYKIRVTSWYAKKAVTSGLINAVIKTRKIVHHIEVHVENAELILSNCTTTNLTTECERPDQHNRVRAGRSGGQNGTQFGWSVLRSRLTFDLSELQKKHGEVESATLIPGDLNTCRDSGSGACLGNLVVLKAGDVTTWNHFQVPQNAILYPLTGWSTPMRTTGGVDITNPVRDWITGHTANFGFVVTGVSEQSIGCAPHHTPMGYACLYECLTYFKPIMYVTFIETVNPCNPT